MAAKNSILLGALGAILAGAICGCATPYQPNGVGGGYADSRIDSHTVTVSFTGNRFTPSTEIEMNLLYRCAEITHQSGFDYFVLLDPRTRKQIAGIRGYANSGVSREALKDPDTFFPPNAVVPAQWGGTTTIRMMVAKNPDRGMAAYHADQVIEALGPKVQEHDTSVGNSSLAETIHHGIPYTGDMVPDSTAMP